jgi:hypothetical protein
VIRRYSFVPILCLLLVSFSHDLIAQVYPDREELDVVRLVDGTVLKGVILEEVPERYLEIQLYGGSTFVLGFEQIESVEQETNPDYGTRWIKVDLGDWGATTTETADTSGFRPGDNGTKDKRSLRDGGVTVGAYLGMGNGWFSGPDAVPDTVETFETAEVSDTSMGTYGGVMIRATRQPVFLTDTIWVWGVRGGLGVADRDSDYKFEDPVDNNESGGGMVEKDRYTTRTSGVPSGRSRGTDCGVRRCRNGRFNTERRSELRKRFGRRTI